MPNWQNDTTRSEQDKDVRKTPHYTNIASGHSPDAREEVLNQNWISIPSPLPPRKTLQIPFAKLAEPVEDSLFVRGNNLHEIDDHEQPLPQLIYKILLSLPPDVRSQCMARIMITGGGSNIAGLKTRLLNDLKAILEERGWNPIRGKAAEETRRHLKAFRNSKLSVETLPKEGPETHLQPQVEDEITEKLEKEKLKTSNPMVAGKIRGVETLGAWLVGALLLA